ncbi:orotate phosphoribosyltransferase [Halarchaeum rubridurum]|uniref:Transcriptional regulator GfcR n=1 Tax=Halarchaeum rubridurum TaxID=489911 RepID=A0A830G269_9EURY|nr:transcriptional regulator GfcR [Halarchaeum rubridurum]MBP1955333.1 orotate phosphoribosyltransferase [Halarchaeum rubridurum]GGM71566.1 orotate phosphoribosyltransferase [Halarchaeum rubridurum]
MKNVDDLIDSAGDLAARGLSRGEIADELNVSRETASWLVERAGRSTGATDVETEPASAGGPQDVHVDWSAIGEAGARLSAVGVALADLLREHSHDVDLVIGVEKAGVPLATAVARELETDLGTYTPRKHQWEEGDIEDLGGSFSRNFAQVEGRDCFIVDDTITSGTTINEAVEAIEETGGHAIAAAVLVDKQGVGDVEGVPVDALMQVIRVGNDSDADGDE